MTISRGRLPGRSLVTVAALVALSAAVTASCGGDDFEPGDSPDGGGTSGSGGSTAGSAGAGAVSGSAGAAGSGGSGGSGGTAGTAGTAGSGGSSGSSGKDPNGTACTSADTCDSAHCADGVCCDSACDGDCESCNGAGDEGSCKPHAAGQDPETECGPSTCTAGSQTDNACDGAGACAPTETSCGNYSCGASTCNSSCSGAPECAATAWCNAGQCDAKKANGGACAAAEQCSSNICAGSFCCATACASPQSCSTGTCKCNGATCTAGATCITWYLDADGDGHGVTGPKNTLGCSNVAPQIDLKPGVKTATDCDDTDANAKPGQTGYFTVPRNGGGWDYDCNGFENGQYAGVAGGTCQACPFQIGAVCSSCQGGFAISPAYSCKPSCGGGNADTGYKIIPTPTCGKVSTLYKCSASGSACGVTDTSLGSVTQGCH
jgi:hypothetical protein